MFVIFGALIV